MTIDGLWYFLSSLFNFIFWLWSTKLTSQPQLTTIDLKHPSIWKKMCALFYVDVRKPEFAFEVKVEDWAVKEWKASGRLRVSTPHPLQGQGLQKAVSTRHLWLESSTVVMWLSFTLNIFLQETKNP